MSLRRLIYSLAERLDQERGRLVPWLGAEREDRSRVPPGARWMSRSTRAMRLVIASHRPLRELRTPCLHGGGAVGCREAEARRPRRGIQRAAGEHLDHGRSRPRAATTVIIKPAPQDSLMTLKLVRLAPEVGFPPGVVNSVNGIDAEIGRELVRSSCRRPSLS